MNNKILFEIGETKVYVYQKIIALVGVVLALFFLGVAIFTQNQYYKLFPVVILILFTTITLIYSMIYSVKADQEYFYVRNVFKKKKIRTGEFIQIKNVRGFELLMVIVFQKERFYLMNKSKDFYKNLFKSKDNMPRELTIEIKKFIEKIDID